jgi:3-phenylpropionate/trans-cinnamate dioxygenase ferredoxin reductase subunit
MEDGSFSVYHFKGSHLIAVDSVNSVKDHVQARKLLDSGVSPTMAQVANAEFGLGA